LYRIKWEDDSEEIWKEAVVAKFEALSWNFLRRDWGKTRKPSGKRSVLGADLSTRDFPSTSNIAKQPEVMLGQLTWFRNVNVDTKKEQKVLGRTNRLLSFHTTRSV
jgi:hypothetical protein